MLSWTFSQELLGLCLRLQTLYLISFVHTWKDPLHGIFLIRKHSSTYMEPTNAAEYCTSQ